MVDGGWCDYSTHSTETSPCCAPGLLCRGPAAGTILHVPSGKMSLNDPVVATGHDPTYPFNSPNLEILRPTRPLQSSRASAPPGHPMTAKQTPIQNTVEYDCTSDTFRLPPSMPFGFDPGTAKPSGSAVRLHAISQSSVSRRWSKITTSRNADRQPSDECLRLARNMSKVPRNTEHTQCLGMKAPGHGDDGDLQCPEMQTTWWSP